MRTLSTLIAALSVPIILFNLLSGIVGGIWLIVLGMWKPIIVCLGILFSGSLIIGILLLPSLIFALPAAKAEERGNTKSAIFIGLFALFYTTALIVAWAFVIMMAFSRMGDSSAQWPLMLVSYSAATGPWAYMASKEERANPGGSNHSAIHVFFLAIGYIIAISAGLVGSASLHTCFWIICVTMIIAMISQFLIVAEESRIRRNYGIY